MINKNEQIFPNDFEGFYRDSQKLLFQAVWGEAHSFFSHSEDNQTGVSSQNTGAAADIELVCGI